MAEVARLYPALPELEVRVLSRIFGHTLQRRMNGPHVEFVISQPEAAPSPAVPPPPPVEEVKAVITRRVTKAEKPPKTAAQPPPPKAASQQPTREMLDLELIGSGATSHRRHRDDLFEL
jgi:hypothetical protein